MGAAPVNVIGPATVTDVTDGGAVETAVITSPPCNVDPPQTIVTVSGYVNVTPGDEATDVVVKLYRGPTIEGTPVGSSIDSAAIPGDDLTIPYLWKDTPPSSHGLVYTVSVTETAAEADGTVNVATIGLIVSQAS